MAICRTFQYWIQNSAACTTLSWLITMALHQHFSTSICQMQWASLHSD